MDRILPSYKTELEKKVPDLLDYSKDNGYIDFSGHVNSQHTNCLALTRKLKTTSVQSSQPKQIDISNEVA